MVEVLLEAYPQKVACSPVVAEKGLEEVPLAGYLRTASCSRGAVEMGSEEVLHGVPRQTAFDSREEAVKESEVEWL